MEDTLQPWASKGVYLTYGMILLEEVPEEELNSTVEELKQRPLSCLQPDLNRCGWFNRAWRNKDCSPENSFEPFIFAWIAFNSWGMCVTEYERDSDIIDALAVNQKLNEDFQELMGGSKRVQRSRSEIS